MNLIPDLIASAGLRMVALAVLIPLVAGALAVILGQFQRHASAATRHLLWLLAFVIMAVGAPLALCRIEVPVAILPPAAPAGPPPASARVWPVSPGPLRGVLTYDDGVSLPDPLPLHPIPARPRMSNAANSPAPRWLFALAGLWLAGLAFLGLRALAGTLRLRAIIQRSRAVDEAPLTDLWNALRASIDHRAPVRLRLSGEVAIPLVTGLLRPVVLLPESAPGWPPAMLRAALLHELAHLQRHDLWTAAFTRLVVAGYWFHPVAWAARRALQAEAEMAADDCVILWEAQPVAYAESLVTLVRALRAGVASPFPAIGMARGPQIEARVQRILDPGQERRAPRRWIRWSAISTAAVLAALALILRPVAAAQPFDPSVEPPPAGEPEPFALSSFRLDSSYEEPSVPPLLDKVKGELTLPSPFVYKVRPAWVEYRHGVRIDLPIGPVRIDYGTPLQKDGGGNAPGKVDAPGPGYREETPLKTESGPVSAELQAKIIAGCQAAFRDVSSVRFAIATQTVYAAAYLEKNPHRARFDHVTEVYSGIMVGERLRVAAAITEANGHRIPDYLQTYDGKQYNFFSGLGSPWMTVGHTLPIDGAGGAYELGTAVFLPYTFLYLTSDDYFVPTLSLQRVTDPAAWAEVFKKAQVIDASEQAGLLRIKFPLGMGDSWYLVTFSTDDGYYPISFEKYGPPGLAQRYLIESFATAQDTAGHPFRYPQKAKFESFLHGWPRNTITVETTQLAVNEDTKDIAFTIDPGLATNIIDGDKEPGQ